MSKPTDFSTGLRGGFPRRLFRAAKICHQYLHWRRGTSKKLLFIVGCQRSGTTLLHDLLDRRLDTKGYRESSEITSKDPTNRLRLIDLDRVRVIIDGAYAPFIIIKALVETQNVHKLLQAFPGSRAIFLYRHYEGVVASDLRTYGLQNGIANLTPIVGGDPKNWRSEGTSRVVQDIITRYFRADMNPYDAGALFWFSRNALFFDLGLNQLESVRLLRYERLVAQPSIAVSRMRQFVGLDGNCRFKVERVRTDSIRKGSDIGISSDVQALCSELLDRLDGCSGRQLLQ
ncbi:MAG: sulfotransferase [Gammaproteobacteria bacterium]